MNPRAAIAAGIGGGVVATVVQVALSSGYGLILSAVIARFGMRKSVAAGAVFGAILYLVNMYGATTLFPWFDATREPITLAAHVVFGIAVARCFRVLDRARLG